MQNNNTGRSTPNLPVAAAPGPPMCPSALGLGELAFPLRVTDRLKGWRKCKFFVAAQGPARLEGHESKGQEGGEYPLGNAL